ncbi:MAG: gliding motility-associated C-terminal domain-containing protein [Saprospiraceae bacterium]|nr:gliding motility-associated C-terminal domain-containing protein [Saprospiraceae bacterium]
MKLGFKEFNRIIITGFLLVFMYGFAFSQGSSPQPDTICSHADVFCDSASMVGPWTLPKDLINNITQSVCTGSTVTGNFDNQLFFPFVPSSNDVEFEIIIQNLQADASKPPTEAGYQWGIVDGCDFTSNNYILCDGSKIQDPVTTIHGTNFKPGHTYYFYIDGYSGSEVTFRLRVLKGIGNLKVDHVDYFNVEGVGEYFANDTVKVCHNGIFKIAVEGVNNAASFIWQVDGKKENSDTSLIYRFKNTGVVYKVEAQGYTDCASSPFGALYFQVDTIADEKLKDTIVCANDLSGGVNPYGWLGGVINKDGISRFKVVYPNGCYHWQQVRVIKKIEPIVSVDSVLCNSISVVFGGETFTRDTTKQMIYSTPIGCDSIVNYRFYFMRFNGSVSQLECFNGTSYMIKVIPDNFNANDFDSLKVNWLRNNLPFTETKTFELYPISLTGTYSAIVTVYKNNRSCSFDLNDVIITEIPNAAFSLNTDLICETDSIVLSLNNYINNVSYNISSPGSSSQSLGNGKYKLKWNTPGVYSVKVETDFNGCKSDYISQVIVKKELDLPVVSCVKSTNTSVEFDWIDSDSDCLEEYEVWINGAFYKKLNSGPEAITGLNYGEEVKITVKAISDCVCPGKIDSAVCKALPCPERKLEITGIPKQICEDQLPDYFQLGYKSDTAGTPAWSGSAVDNGGKLSKSKLKIGENFVYLEYRIGECIYNFDTSITVFPSVKFDFSITDISCYDSSDGSFSLNPVQGSPDFTLTLNGKSYSDFKINGLASGNYNVELKDSKGCTAKSSFSLIKPDKLFVEINGEDKVNFNQAYTYFVESDFDEVDSITWYLNDSIICSNRFCDSVKIIPADDFNLCVELFYGQDCKVEDCIDVRVNKDFDVYVPNVFTPNFDSVNDFFRIKSTNGVEVNVKTMQIFDRWGELLYKKDNFVYGNNEEYVGWDGRFHEKLSPPGVYVYYIEILKENGDITRLAGDITLLR